MSLKSRAALVLGVIALTVGSFAPTALADSGGLDTGFGTGGSTVLPANTTVSQSIKTADGGFALVGTVGVAPTRDAFVAKLTSGGAFDTAFSGDGFLAIDAGGDDLGAGISVRPGGGYVVTGADDHDQSASVGFVAKTTAAGTMDAWGTGGVLLITEGPALNDRLSLISRANELAGGDVIYAASQGAIPGNVLYFGRVGGAGDWATGTYTPLTVALSQSNSAHVDLLRRTDGNWALVSTSSSPTTAPVDVIVNVFSDTSVSVSETITASAVPITVRHAYLVSGDRLIATGSTATAVAAPNRGAIWRFTAAGALDSSFGTAGTLQLPTATGGWVAAGYAADSTGKVYVNGDVSTDRVRTLRLNADFTLDPTFGEGGFTDRTYGASPNRAENIFVDASDRPVATGTFNTSGAAWRIERFDYASTLLGEVTYSPSFVQRLNTVNFSYSVKNNGPDASDVVIDIDVPAQFESQNYSTSFGSVAVAADGTGGTWTIPQLAAGSTATLTLSGKPGEVGMLKTTATILSQSANRVGAAATPMSTQVMVYGAATPRDDVIYGTPRKDIIDALTGDDVVFALAGNDIIDGNEGNDKIYGQVGDDIVRGNNGNDLVDGGSGNDTALGGAGTDRVLGGSGNDAVDGGAGNDFVDGGIGNDKVAGGTGDDLLYGRTGNDRLNSGDGNDKVFAGQGNDTVFGGAGADKLYGEGGNDYLIAQGSGDQLFGGPGRDRLDGGADADRIFGGTGDDWINGKTGNDIMNGNTGNDWIRGFAGNDRLIGGGGDDLLNGGSGKDVFSAGSGDDIIRADDAFGGDVINCGVGWDLVYANPGDSIDSNCEYVKFDVPAGTRYSGDRGSNAPAQWAQRVRRG